MKKAETVHLFPAAGFYVPGVPAIEQDVTPERAAELLAYRPPAFTTDPPAAPATEPTGPADAESTDSEEPS